MSIPSAHSVQDRAESAIDILLPKCISPLLPAVVRETMRFLTAHYLEGFVHSTVP